MNKMLIVILLLRPQEIAGQTPGRKEATNKDRRYKKQIRKAAWYTDSPRAGRQIPGIAVCAGTKEKIPWEGFGYADLENKVPITTNSRFRIGSVSKSLTALALGKPCEEGKLAVDVPVQNYVTGFPEKKYPVAVRQLAGHTAGIRHCREGYPLACPDSTYGYNLLGAVIEGISRPAFLSYMRANVFLPLGMPNLSCSSTHTRTRACHHGHYE